MKIETKFDIGDKVVYKHDPLKSPRDISAITFVYYNNGTKDISYFLSMSSANNMPFETWIREEELERYWDITSESDFLT